MEIKKLSPAFVDERGSIWDFLTDDTIHHCGYLISKKNFKVYRKLQKVKKLFLYVLHL